MRDARGHPTRMERSRPESASSLARPSPLHSVALRVTNALLK